MFFADRIEKDRLLGVLTGVLTNEDVDLIKWGNHIFVEETLDGGATVWLKHNVDGSEVKRFKLDDRRKGPEELSSNWPPAAQLTGYEIRKEDSVPIRCKCGGVDFVLHQGDYANIEEKDVPYNIDPKTHKLLASLCPCDSCRLQAGVDTMTWTFADMKNISFANGDASFPDSAPKLKKRVDENDPAFGTLKYYASSSGVERYFCGRCSACIFYATDERPQIVDIAIGVLRASDGARAEGFLSWPYGSRPEFIEDGNGGWREGVYTRVLQDTEEYRISRGYPKIVGIEEANSQSLHHVVLSSASLNLLGI